MPDTMDWNSVQTWERLVACILASGVKLDLKLVASYYGTTYWALQNKFRRIKKDADELTPNVEVGEDGEASVSPVKKSPKTPRKPKTPKKEKLETVKGGRVTKSKSPSKNKAIKQEPVDDEDPDDGANGNHNGPSLGIDDDMFT